MGDDRSSARAAQRLAEAESSAPAVHYDDEERPARELSGRVGAAVSIAAFGAALLVLWQVFRPLAQGSQFYLIIFLAGTLRWSSSRTNQASVKGGKRPP
jgi:hypothetical protein